MSLSNRLDRRVMRVGLIAVIAVYFLILVGGTVRATGAGMGCPDWPLCFGQIVPPTHESQLPANWREIYADRGYDKAPFDATKTWIEYINRLTGVTIGFLIIGFVFVAARFRKIDPPVFWVAVLGLLAVAFNGWLGSKVVASNLRPVMISLHMAGAFFVQMALIYATTRAARERFAQQIQGGLPNWFRHLLLATMLALIVQIVLGLQIRESVDWIAKTASDVERNEWIQLVPQIFYVHRSFSWVILALAGFLTYKVFKSRLRGTAVGKAAYGLVGLVTFEMLLGGALNHLGFPAIAQPVHLLVAHLIFGVLWFQWCVLSVSQYRSNESLAARSPADTQSQPASPSANRNSYV
ncbi:COX15/CtaA family protein [beta proteobacterium MWH-UniP1]